MPKLDRDGNKYTRGHAVVVGGGMTSTGAARLAAISALRVGAGLVTVTSPTDALAVYASHLTAVMLTETRTPRDLQKFLADDRITSVLIGPGCGVTEETRKKVIYTLETDRALVLDADAITVFKDSPQELFGAIERSDSEVVLTPHEGEFERLFKLTKNRKQDVIKAAKESGAVVLLKGAETIIAAPNGTYVISNNAPPSLATAGSGDVLAGIITGLIAQGMDVFIAACVGAYLHGEAANEFGLGLIAEDLPDLLPKIIQKYFT